MISFFKQAKPNDPQRSNTAPLLTLKTFFNEHHFPQAKVSNRLSYWNNLQQVVRSLGYVYPYYRRTCEWVTSARNRKT
jgi:hypothetical protein